MRELLTEMPVNILHKHILDHRGDLEMNRHTDIHTFQLVVTFTSQNIQTKTHMFLVTINQNMRYRKKTGKMAFAGCTTGK